MATIHDVAQRAGVSPITVSRVINHSGYASQDTRERVEAAVAELGYVPNRLARSLRSKRTHTLALVITDITNPFFTTVARGVEDTASDAGYTVIFCNTDESESEETEIFAGLVAAAGRWDSAGAGAQHARLDRYDPETEHAGGRARSPDAARRGCGHGAL